MISITNRQRSIKVNVTQLKKDAQKILDTLDYADYDLGILLTTNKTIRAYNKTYRKKDKPTDILSFSYHPTLKVGQRIKPKTEEDKNVGDLILSLEYIKKDAKNYDATLEQRLRVLLVHGICHLLGYDHENDNDYEVMSTKEAFLLKKLGN